MPDEDRNKTTEFDKENYNHDSTSQRPRLDSYVNIESNDIPNEIQDQEGTLNKSINTKKDRSKSLSDLFPCGVCGVDLGKRYKGKSVLCMGCMHWCHLTKCSGLSSEKEYRKGEYKCPSCVKEYPNYHLRDINDSPQSQKENDINKENLDLNSSNVENKKSSGRKVSFFDNSPIITGGREYPEKKRKRKNKETSDNSENKTEEEKSPISKKTKLKDKKKNEVKIMDDQRSIKCIDCNQNYITVSNNNPEEIRCIGCNAGIHDCLKEPNSILEDKGKSSKGFVWMCRDCMESLQIEKVKEDEKSSNSTTNENNKKKTVEKDTLKIFLNIKE